jgi:ankyrin repeat protein
MRFEPRNLLMELIVDTSSTASDISQVLQTSSEGDINASDPSGFTALHYACIMQSEVKCSLLLRAKADVNSRDELGMTPLHFSSSQFFNRRIMTDLIKFGANVNAYSNRLLTPLFLAVEKGREEAISLLLECGADPLLENDQFDSVLKHADRKDLLSAFKRHGCALDACKNKVTACGLWVLASLFNHNSSPNTYRTHVGKLMFIRAAQDLVKGTEMTVAYMQDSRVLKQKWGINQEFKGRV